MKTIVLDALQVVATIVITCGVLVSASPIPITTVENKVEQVKTAPVLETASTDMPVMAESPVLTTETIAPVVTLAVTPAVVAPLDNKTITWNFLTAQGFTRNQTAGIMGNLQQEHGFQTSDVPGGLGIAQWMGNRRDNLMARANYLDINVQLQFMMDELNESGLSSVIKSVDRLDSATITFQNKYERCGICMESNRINYARAILNSY